MKPINKLIAAVMLGVAVLGPGARDARADLEVSAGVSIHANADFVAPLTPHGTWVEVGTYGRCFRPVGVVADWRPYCEGEWVWTDCGWYWESDEPWAWACYHYGTWVDDPVVGWVWVPGIEWAPAWVEWRFGGGFVGWAPCAPHGVIVAPALFAFVDVAHFHDPIRRSTVVINNTTIFSRTSHLAAAGRETRTIGGHEQKVMVNRGPEVAAVEKAGGHKFTAVPIREAVTRVAPRHEPAVEHNVPAPVEHKVTPPVDNPPAYDHPGKPDDRPDVGAPDHHSTPDAGAPPDRSSRNDGEGRDHGGDRGGGDHGGGHGRGDR